MVIKGYACGKDTDKYSCSKVDKTTDNSDTGNITVTDNKFNTLSNFKIYGNSYQQTYSGKNLLDESQVVAGNISTSLGNNSVSSGNYRTEQYFEIEKVKYMYHDNYDSINKIIYYYDENKN